MTFFDEYCANPGFYKRLGLDYGTTFHFGQLFKTHAYYPHENVQLWRPVRLLGPTQTIAEEFRIEPAGGDAFKRNLPLGAPKLGAFEEFLVIRAKRRPVLLLQPENPLLDELNEGYKGKLQRHLCNVAQIFSLTDRITEEAKYDPAFVSRVRLLEFPQFMFLPKQAGLLEVDSLLRLDELQSVFTPRLEPLQYALGDEATEALRDQLQILLTGTTRPNHNALKQLLLAD